MIVSDRLKSQQENGRDEFEKSFPVPSGGMVQVGYATPRTQARLKTALRAWVRSVKSEANPIKRDAAELGQLAFRRWREAYRKHRIATSLEEIRNFVQDNPYAEVAMLITARAPWLRGSSIVGLCHFRRTWCNNIFIDFLAANPRAVGRIGGIGVGLLYYVAFVARQVKAKAIWGEATQNSVEFYKKVFERAAMEDLIFLPEGEYNTFGRRMEKKWRVPLSL